MHEYLFDVKLFASIRIRAASPAEARKQLNALLDCATVNFGADANADPVIGEASLAQDDGGADLVEIDNEAV